MAQIFYATNRDVRADKNGRVRFGKRFNRGGPQMFRLGHVSAKLDGNPLDDDDWDLDKIYLYPEILGGDNQQLGSTAFLEELRQELRQDTADVVVYLHGFANDFRNTAKRTAALQHLYNTRLAKVKRRVVMVAFSWPSNGTAVDSYNYHSDRDDAALSGIAMARTLMRLVSFLQELRSEDRKVLMEAQRAGRVPTPSELAACNRSIHIVAHSMGNWALRNALNRFAEMNNGTVPRIIDHAFLVAADDDADTLSHGHKMGKLLRLANYIHVYHARDDRALEISDKTKGNSDRLGAHGPENLDLLDERVMAIDCQDVSDTSLSHGRHQYYRLRREVISDMVATMCGVTADRPTRSTIRPGRSWRLKEGLEAVPRPAQR